MLIPLLELVIYFNGRLQEHPPISTLPWRDVCDSTLAYLNLYRQLQDMLNHLGEQANAILTQMKGD